jgi:hypothetical protein
MISILVRGSEMQQADYWLMLPHFLNPNGSLHLAGLFHFHNEHPVVVTQLLYWLNFRAFSGKNIPLGLAVVGLAVGELAVVGLLLRHRTWRTVDRIAMFALASALLFDRKGTWNFTAAMSGTAWFTADLFALIAIYLRSRDRDRSAFAVAVLAAVSYGTGIMVWPAMIVVGMCRRPVRAYWREWPYAAAFVVTYVWYRFSGPGDSGTFSHPATILRSAVSVLGFVLGVNGRPGDLIGYLVLIGVPVLALYLVRSRVGGVSAWVGLATFGWLALIEISAGRLDIVAINAKNRYTSLAAIVWIGFAGLLILALHDIGPRLTKRTATGTTPSLTRLTSAGIAVVVAVPLLFGALTAGRVDEQQMLDLNSSQERAEIAWRFGLADNTLFMLGLFGSRTNIESLLRSTGHYPFISSWNLDCGLYGRHLDRVARSVEPPIRGAVLSSGPAVGIPGSVEITGHVITAKSIRCIIVANAQDVVVGAAAVGGDAAGTGAHRPSGTGFDALAKNGGSPYRIYVVLKGDATPLALGPASQG